MGFRAVFGGGFRPVFDPGGAALPWWLTGGVAAAACVAAYQPKGAASQIASYVNLVSPGAHDAIPTSAPSWGATTGWTFTTLQYLTTDIVPSTDASWSMIVRFSDWETSNYATLAGMYSATGACLVGQDNTGKVRYFNGASNSVFTGAAKSATGVLAIGGKVGYINGAKDGDIAAGYGTQMYHININGYWQSNSSNVTMSAVKMQAFAIYNAALTDIQVAAISAAMAAL
jgi:hypothetical protein